MRNYTILQAFLSKKLLFLIVFLGLSIPVKVRSQWVQTNGPSIVYGEVEVLAASGSTLFAEVNGFVYRSTNDGSNWSHAENGLNNNGVTVFASDSVNVFAATDSGVYKSTDDGISWFPVNNGLSILNITALTVSDSTVVAGTNGGIFRSTNDGLTWSLSDTGLTDSSITTLVSDAGCIYAGTENGLFLSSDGGSHWKRIDSSPVSPDIVSIACSKTAIFVSASGRVFRSTDNGLSWLEKDNSSVFFAGRAGKLTVFINDTTIFAGTIGMASGGGSQSYISTNDGEWWSIIGGLSWATIFLTNGQNIYAGTFLSGLFRSTDGGANWTSANDGFANGQVKVMAASGDELLAMSRGYFCRSTDQGSTWTENDTSFGGDASSLVFINSYAFSVGQGVFRSTDAGVHWTLQDSATRYYPIGSIVSIGSNIFAATSVGVSASNDNGVSWHPVSSGMFSENISETEHIYPPIVCTLAALDTDLFAGTYGSGIFKSTNLGVSWTPADSGLPLNGDTMVTAMSAYGKNVFASVNAEVYLSTDEGNSWIQANNGLKGWIESFAVGDTDAFVGTSGGGVFIFKSSNRTWIPVNEGLGDLGVYSLAAANGELYAGTGSSGVWKRPIAEMVLDGIKNVKTNMPFGYRLYQNYPNPFNPTTTITYTIPKDGMVTLKIYDVLGREVETLVSEVEKMGRYEATFDGSRLASGVYFYRLTAPGIMQVKKMLLLK